MRCPNCQTEISLPPAGPARSCWRRRGWGLAVVAVLLLGLAAAGYRYRGQVITVVDLANEVTGSTSLSVAGLALAAFVAVSVVAWLLVPFLLLGAGLDLRRRGCGCADGGRCRGTGPVGARDVAGGALGPTKPTASASDPH